MFFKCHLHVFLHISVTYEDEDIVLPKNIWNFFENHRAPPPPPPQPLKNFSRLKVSGKCLQDFLTVSGESHEGGFQVGELLNGCCLGVKSAKASRCCPEGFWRVSRYWIKAECLEGA